MPGIYASFFSMKHWSCSGALELGTGAYKTERCANVKGPRLAPRPFYYYLWGGEIVSSSTIWYTYYRGIVSLVCPYSNLNLKNLKSIPKLTVPGPRHPGVLISSMCRFRAYCKRAPACTETLLLFSYEGGDSEFINYLIYILQENCVQTVSTF